MNKTKAILITTLPPPIHGSAMVSQFIKDSKLINDEFDMDFINLSTSRKMDEIGKTSPLLLLKKLGRFILSFIYCFWLLLTNKYELCYCAITCHGTGFLKDTPFVLLCKLFRLKVVIHQHNKGMSKCVDKWPYRWLLPLVYSNTKVMLLSWYLYDDISKIVSRNQILICPNGIPKITHNVDSVEKNNTIPRLLFLSNLVESKGVFVLLDACKILKDKGYSFVCDFVGGETKEITRIEFENAILSRCLTYNVQYHGPKYGLEKEYFWNTCDIFVQPTFEDCFPLTIIEAMQHKLPVVSTTEGAIRDMVKDGENGFICNRYDAEALADALEKMISNKHLRFEMGIKGYEMYKKCFTLDVFEKRIKDIFVECKHL